MPGTKSAHKIELADGTRVCDVEATTRIGPEIDATDSAYVAFNDQEAFLANGAITGLSWHVLGNGGDAEGHGFRVK